MNRTSAYILSVLGLTALVGCVGQPVNTGVLVKEMTDLKRLAEVPSPEYRTIQFSSYDRTSNLPSGPGWFANSDGFGGETVPAFEAVLKAPNADGVGEYLICDVKGPGAIVRTWTAAIEGTIRLYLDEGWTPLYDGPASDFMHCPYRAIAAKSGVDAARFEKGFQQRDAGYCPIPFARRCRLIWTGKLKDIHFYQVQIRRYDFGAMVSTFTPDDLKQYDADLSAAAKMLTDPDGTLPPASTAPPLPIDVTVAPGERTEALKLPGPQALQWLTLKVTAGDTNLALRQTILHIICDGYPWGQVQAPVGDFFGAAPGVNPYVSLPFTVAPDGTMTCRYVMPFASQLRIVLENRGQQPVTVAGSAQPAPYSWSERSMHFHAHWRVNHGIESSGQAPRDMPFIIVRGAGRYVGTALMLLNPCQIPTTAGGWWGEGDEKVFVDDEATPSTFGTGSEDYFNYSWSVPDIFSFAYCGQPRDDGPGNRGFVTNDRWHIIDDLPFRHHLAFYLELFSHDRVPGMSYARIGYYYARPGAIDDHVVISDEDLRPLALPATWTPAARGAMEKATYSQCEEISQSPEARTAIETGPLWAGGQLLVWQPARAGEELALRFSTSKDGKYRVHLGCMLDERSGRISATLDGDPVKFDGSDKLDLHVQYRLLARQFGTEPVELKTGEHVLKLRFDGAEQSIGTPVIGLDYLAVQPE